MKQLVFILILFVSLTPCKAQKSDEELSKYSYLILEYKKGPLLDEIVGSSTGFFIKFSAIKFQTRESNFVMKKKEALHTNRFSLLSTAARDQVWYCSFNDNPFWWWLKPTPFKSLYISLRTGNASHLIII